MLWHDPPVPVARLYRLIAAALLALGLVASPAGAQVWKPKKKTTPAAETKPKAKPKPKAKAKPRRRATRPARTRSRPARTAKPKPKVAKPRVTPPVADDQPEVTTEPELEYDDDPIIVIVDGEG